MNKFNKTAILSLTSLFMCATAANAEVVAPQAPNAAPKMEKTSDTGTIIFRIENIKPVKDKQENVKQCSYIITAYNRMNKAVKEANLEFMWRDNITGQYINRIDESAKLTPDEITEQLSSDAKEMRQNIGNDSQKAPMQFQPILSNVKFFNIAPHSQKSFSDTVDTDKCFLLFDNLNYRIKNCTYDGQATDDKVGCAEKFQYISTKNPEYYVEFGDVPENIVQDQVEDEKNMEMEKINNSYDEIVSTLEKVDNTLRNMR